MNIQFDELKSHLNTQRKIRVERNRPSNELLNGYLMALSETLGVMHCFHDFLPDGYSVFRLEDVVSLRSGEYERHWDRMLAGEGLLDGLKRQITIDLGSLKAAIQWIDKEFKLMTVQCEDNGNNRQDFYIGRIDSTTETALVFHHFDGLGQWAEEPAAISLDEITLVQFDTPYIKHFSKYVGGFSVAPPK
jgi:hypothetical protein